MLTITRGARFAAAFCVLSLAALAIIPPIFDARITSVRQEVVAVSDQQDYVNQVVLALALQVASIRGYSLNGDPALVDEYREARRRQDAALDELKVASELNGQGFVAEVEALRAAAVQWGQFPEEVSSQKADRALAAARIPAQQQLYRAALDAGRNLELRMRTRVTSGRLRIAAAQRLWRFTSFGLGGLAAICGFILLASLRRTLAQGELARRDPLTGLLNRRGFDEAARMLMRRAERDGIRMTLMAFDLDGFKAVNDIQGHATGDRLLRDLGVILDKAARRTDLVARLGGDEFAILLEHSRGEGTEEAVRRLRDEVRSRMADRQWPVTLSVGAVTFKPGESALDALEHQADELMYAAKKSGKNTIRIAAANTPD